MRKRFAANVVSLDAHRKKKSGNWKSFILGQEEVFLPPVWFKVCMAGLLGFTLGAAAIVLDVRDLDKRRIHVPVEESVPEPVREQIRAAFTSAMPGIVQKTTDKLVELCRMDKNALPNKACPK